MNLYWLSFLFYPLLTQAESSCAAEDGVCTNDEAVARQPKAVARQQPSCGEVILPSARGDIYSNGGSAQAYKPNQPEKKEVCDSFIYESWRHRTATWPFYKSSSGRPPKITLAIKPWRCDTAAGQTESACCELLPSQENSKMTVEMWQTRPDGTYSSLRPGEQDGVCRARQQLDTSSSTLTFTTVAPGSTGNLGGLGPYGYDFAPYGPPVIHILALHPDTEPLLLNVPILIQRQTLESTTFKGSDWRGAAWTQKKPGVLPYNITSWEGNVPENSVHIHLDVFLQEQTDQTMSLSKKLCRSWIYGQPSSFFVEPISVCAPSMLDFFALWRMWIPYIFSLSSAYSNRHGCLTLPEQK